jgi:hypothetical protein
MGAQGPTVLTFPHLASVASRRCAWLASPTRACSPVGPPHRLTAGRVSRAAVPSARPRPYLRPPTPTAPRQWRRRPPPAAGRRRARRWSPHTRPARWRWRKHAPTARRCARLRWPGADRRGTHTPAAATNKPDATTVCALHRPAAQPCPCQCQRPESVGSVSVAPPCCLAHAAQSPVAAALHSAGTVRGTARHGAPSAAPKSRDRSGPWRTEIASRRGSAAAPVGSARASVRLACKAHAEVATHSAASSCLSLCLSVSVRKRGTGSLSVPFPSLHLAPPQCDRVPVRASCLVLCLATLCVCVLVPVDAHKWVSVFVCG